VSDIVTTQYGYHVIKLLEKIPAKKMELAAVTSDLRDFLSLQAMQKQIPDYMKKLKEEANVEILDEKLKLKEPDAPAAAAGLPAGHPPVETGKKQ